MNSLLTKILTRQDVSKIPPKRPNFTEKSVEDRVQTFSHEIQNNQKTLALRLEEYQRLKDRIIRLEDPTYVLRLQDRISEIKEKIEKTKRENKQLEWKNKTLGKNIYEIESRLDGFPASVAGANERIREVAVLNKKNWKLEEEIERFEKVAKEQEQKIEELKEQMGSLEMIAMHYSVELKENPQKRMHKELTKEINSYEEGIRIMLNRNGKYIENFFERDMEELRLSCQQDREHLSRLEEMADEQANALRELVEKESSHVDDSIKSLFSKLCVSLDGRKVGESISEVEVKAESRKEKAPLVKLEQEKKELLKHLPIYTPNREMPKNFQIKKLVGPSKLRASNKRERSLDGHDKLWESMMKQGERDNEGISFGDESRRVETEEKKPEREYEERKPAFSKPFGLKKSGAKQGASDMNQDKKSSIMERLRDQTQTSEQKATELITERTDNRNKDSLTLNLSYGNSGPKIASLRGQPLKLLDFGKKDESLSPREKNMPEESRESYINTQQTVFGQNGKVDTTVSSRVARGRMLKKDESPDIKSEALRHGLIKKEPSKQDRQEPGKEVEAEEGFTSEASRLNRNRIIKKEETQGLVLNFWGNAKPIESITTRGASSVLTGGKRVLGGEPTIKDLFAEYDNPNKVDFTKKKTINIGKSEETDDRLTFLGNEELKKEEQHQEEKKPFTLNIIQGPKRILNTNQNGPQVQPLTHSQPQRPQLKLGEPGGVGAWSKKAEDSEIKAIGKSEIEPMGSIWTKKDGYNVVGQKKLEDGGISKSIWDKKQEDTKVRVIGDRPHDQLLLNLTEENEERGSGLRFLTDEKQEIKPELALDQSTQKPKRLKMGEKKEEKKRTLSDSTQGNDFFDDFVI